jgi:mono/diheme cytochrome c family protein
VEDLSRCGQCHTPRDSNGTPDRSRWLQGAPVWLKSAEPTEDWPLQAPRIAGALPGTDAEMVTLLTTGIWRTGTYLRPPMPQFRMSRQDAESVIAYLKSVKSAPK